MNREALKKARAAHREAVESLYEGKCTIYERHSVTDSDTRITKQQEEPVCEGISCALVFSGKEPAFPQGEGFRREQTVRLFLAPEITVRPGSRIEVTQNGVTGSYERSGVPAVYAGHQEVVLKACEEWT